MAEYHVGCGAFGIYAGTLDKDKRLFRNKSDVTDEAIRAVAQYLLENKQGLRFEYEKKVYVLKVMEADNG
jgi:hypothetical protein